MRANIAIYSNSELRYMLHFTSVFIVLLTVYSVVLQDCWSRVNVHKAVYPRLWALLKEGGRGCAAGTFHNLLPLLSRLPTQQHNHRQLYQQFLANVHTGCVM